MEDVLNIDKIIGDRGFMPSSSDDEEDTVQLSKVKTSLSNHLANIFAEEAGSTQFAIEQKASPEKRRSLDSSSITLFSAVVDLYLHETPVTPLVPKGRVGAAVIRNSSELDLLVFYTANKKPLLVVPLGPGKIMKIEKDHRCRLVVFSAVRIFGVTFVKSDDECKLTALLMLLCAIRKVDVEEGSGIELCIGSSVLYEITPLIFDGASMKFCAEEQSKLRISPKSEPWVLQTVGMKKLGKRLLRKDDKSVVLVHVKKIKQHRAADDSTTASLVSVVERLKVDENFEEPKEQRREILRQRASLGQVLPDEILLASETLSSKSGSMSPPSVKLSSEPTIPTEPSVSCEIEDDRPEKSTLCQTTKEQQQGQAGAVNLSADGILNVQKIIGAEIDRLELRLVAALERMVDRQMSSLRGEMQEIKERQETLLKKLEDLQDKREGNIPVSDIL